MKISYLEELEQKYNFRYPELYKQLCEAGLLGDENLAWDEDTFLRVQENPPFLYYSQMNPIEVDELEECIGNINPEENIVYIPFLEIGEFQYICFYFKEKKEENCPIVLYSLGDDYKLLAKSLTDYIFIAFLESACSFFSIKEELEEHHSNINAMLKSHKPYILEQYYEVLEAMISRNFQSVEINGQVLHYIITEAEVEQILEKQKLLL